MINKILQSYLVAIWCGTFSRCLTYVFIAQYYCYAPPWGGYPIRRTSTESQQAWTEVPSISFGPFRRMSGRSRKFLEEASQGHGPLSLIVCQGERWEFNHFSLVNIENNEDQNFTEKARRRVETILKKSKKRLFFDIHNLCCPAPSSPTPSVCLSRPGPSCLASF